VFLASHIQLHAESVQPIEQGCMSRRKVLDKRTRSKQILYLHRC
jgi:hypothetical protein